MNVTWLPENGRNKKWDGALGKDRTQLASLTCNWHVFFQGKWPWSIASSWFSLKATAATPATLKNLATELVGGCHQVAVDDLYQFGRLFDWVTWFCKWFGGWSKHIEIHRNTIFGGMNTYIYNYIYIIVILCHQNTRVLTHMNIPFKDHVMLRCSFRAQWISILRIAHDDDVCPWGKS